MTGFRTPGITELFHGPFTEINGCWCEVARDVQGNLSKPTAKPGVISVGSTDESVELDESFFKSCEVEKVIEEKEFGGTGGEGEIDDRDCSPSQQCRGRR